MSERLQQMAEGQDVSRSPFPVPRCPFSVFRTLLIAARWFSKLATNVLTPALAAWVVLGASAIGAEPPDGLDGIAVQKDENGRMVWVNAPKETPRKAAPAPRARRLVYWSNKEQRWKPVPPPSPSAMRAAQKAAAEVVSYIEAAPIDTQVSAERHGANLGHRAEGAEGAKEHWSPPPGRRRYAVGGRTYNREVLAELDRLRSGNGTGRSYGLARGRAVTSEAVDNAIEQAAARHGVDPNLVRAIVKVESNFNPRAVSRKGAMGLMQLMPQTARSLNVGNPFDPHENVDAGIRHFKGLLDSFGGDVRLSLAAYNAGQGAVMRSNGVPRIAETRNYVKQITQMYWSGDAATLGRSGAAPIKVFRGEDGVLTLSNTD
ncbi:MAG: lytic transglycosylase domain-containing protein [Terriglobales bacterium]